MKFYISSKPRRCSLISGKLNWFSSESLDSQGIDNTMSHLDSTQHCDPIKILYLVNKIWWDRVSTVLYQRVNKQIVSSWTRVCSAKPADGSGHDKLAMKLHSLTEPQINIWIQLWCNLAQSVYLTLWEHLFAVWHRIRSENLYHSCIVNMLLGLTAG